MIGAGLAVARWFHGKCFALRRLIGFSSAAGRSRLAVAAAIAIIGAPGMAAEGSKSPAVTLGDTRDNRVCYGCHGGAAGALLQSSRRTPSLAVDPKVYERSVHRGRACTDCHEDVAAVPHGKVEKVRCGRCTRRTRCWSQ